MLSAIKAFAEDNHVLIFQNVRVRNFFQRPFLTTISNTTITVADDDIKPTLAMQSALPARQQNKRYQKISVKKVAFISHYSLYYNCQNCKKKVTDSTFLKNVKCDTCFAVQRLSPPRQKGPLTQYLKRFCATSLQPSSQHYQQIM